MPCSEQKAKKVIKVPKLEKSEIPKLYGIDSVGQLSRIINDLSVKTYNQTRHDLGSSHNNKLLGKKDEKLNKLVFNIQKKRVICKIRGAPEIRKKTSL